METGLIITLIVVTAIGVVLSNYIGFEFKKANRIFLLIYFPITAFVLIMDIAQDMLGNHKFGMSLFLILWTLISFLIVVYIGNKPLKYKNKSMNIKDKSPIYGLVLTEPFMIAIIVAEILIGLGK
jgi:hypothetical protein